ncbi:MAG: protein-arginine deiminase family protein [Opitutaceae bacterium]
MNFGSISFSLLAIFISAIVGVKSACATDHGDGGPNLPADLPESFLVTSAYSYLLDGNGVQSWNPNLFYIGQFVLPVSLNPVAPSQCPSFNLGEYVTINKLDQLNKEGDDEKEPEMVLVDRDLHSTGEAYAPDTWNGQVFEESQTYLYRKWMYRSTELYIRQDVLDVIVESYWPAVSSSAPITFTWTYPERAEVSHYRLVASADYISDLSQLVDGDRDGIPDWWELQETEGLNSLTGMLADDDGDGLNNYLEHQFFTSPINSDSDGDNLGDGDEITFGSCPRSFDTDGDGIDDFLEHVHGLDPQTNDAGLDPDNDNLTNLQEVGIGTDINDMDTDDDGMPDKWEVRFSFDPLDALKPEEDVDTHDNADFDPDLDGLTNLDEYRFNSNPLDINTDFDLVLYDIAPLTVGTAPNQVTVPMPGRGQAVYHALSDLPYLDPRVEVEESPYGFLPYRAPGDYSAYPLQLGVDGLPIPDPSINPGFYYFDPSTAAAFTPDLLQYPETYFDPQALPQDWEDGLESAFNVYADREITETVPLSVGHVPVLDDAGDPVMVSRLKFVPGVGNLVWADESYSFVTDATGIIDSIEVNRGTGAGRSDDSNWYSLSRTGLSMWTEYSFGAALDTDDDSDGIPDVLESPEQIGTDSSLWDSDGDLMFDGYEMVHGLKPNSDGDGGLTVENRKEKDIDGDDLSNLAEFNLNLLPNHNDSDADGIFDGWEVNFAASNSHFGTLDPREQLDGLVVWWDFDLNDDPRVYDRSVYYDVATQTTNPPNDAFLHGDATFSTDGPEPTQRTTLDLRDSQITLDSYGYLAAPDSPVLELDPSGFTISFWYKWELDNTSHIDYPVGMDIFSPERSIFEKQGAYRAYLEPSAGRFNFEIFTDHGINIVQQIGLEHSKWHHIAVVFDAAMNQLALHVRSSTNSSEVDMSQPALVSATAVPVGAIFVDNDAPLHLGSLKGAPTTYVNSSFDDWRLYTATLTSDALDLLSNPDHTSRDTNRDRDGDHLSEWDEFAWQLDPFNTDFDEDGIPDGLEVHGYVINAGVPVLETDESNSARIVTHPGEADSDGDGDGLSQGHGFNDLEELLGSILVINVTNTLGDPAYAFSESRTIITDPLDTDTDDDGLSDSEEMFVYFTDPTISDTDGDQLPDGWEVQNNFNPLDHSGEEDYDGDGWLNSAEYPADSLSDRHILIDDEAIALEIADAEIRTRDSDSDGITDFLEDELGTDPNNEDSDGDGMTDSDENRYGYDPLDPSDFETDPITGEEPDSDGDGISDQDEIAARTNPWDASNASLKLTARSIFSLICCEISPRLSRHYTGGNIYFPVPILHEGEENEELSPKAPWDVYLMGGADTLGMFANAGEIKLGGWMRSDIEEFEGKDDPAFEIHESGRYVTWTFAGSQSDGEKFYAENWLDPLAIHTEEAPFYNQPVNLRRFLNHLQRDENGLVLLEVTYNGTASCSDDSRGGGGETVVRPPEGTGNANYDEIEEGGEGGESIPHEGEFIPQDQPIESGGGDNILDFDSACVDGILAFTETSLVAVNKILSLNDGDADGDAVPDYADGLVDLYLDDGVRHEAADEVPESANFYAMEVTIPASYTPYAEVLTRISYEASNPAAITRTGDETDGYTYTPAEGALRVWTKDGGELRAVAPVNAEEGEESGDFVPSGEYLSFDQLGFTLDADTGNYTTTLYVESLTISEKGKPEFIHIGFVDPAKPLVSEDHPPSLEYVQAFMLLKMDIVADNNRDGVISDADNQQPADYDPAAYPGTWGAIYNVNLDRDSDTLPARQSDIGSTSLYFDGNEDQEDYKIETGDDINDITPFIIRTPSILGGVRVWLTADELDLRRVHIFKNISVGEPSILGSLTDPSKVTPLIADEVYGVDITSYLDPSDPEYCGVISLESRDALQKKYNLQVGDCLFGLEGLYFRSLGHGASDSFWNYDGILTLKLELRDEADTSRMLASDSQDFRVAPWLMRSSSVPGRELFVAGDSSARAEFQSAIPNVHIINNSHLFPQDWGQIGYTQRPGSNSLTLALLSRSGPGQFRDKMHDRETIENGGSFTINTTGEPYDQGGNWELAPPSVDAPLGRFVTSDDHPERGLINFIKSQLQATNGAGIIDLNVDQFATGHVDEVVSFLKSSNQVIAFVPDIELAFEVLDEEPLSVLFQKEPNIPLFGEVAVGTSEMVNQGDQNTTLITSLSLNDLSNGERVPGEQSLLKSKYVAIRIYESSDVSRRGFVAVVKGIRDSEYEDGSGNLFRQIVIGQSWQTGTRFSNDNEGVGKVYTEEMLRVHQFSSGFGQAGLPIVGDKFVLCESSLLHKNGMPAVVTAYEIISDTHFRQQILSGSASLANAVLNEHSAILSNAGYTVKGLPTLFYWRDNLDLGIGYASLIPNPVNLQFWQGTPYIPESYGPINEEGKDLFKIKYSEVFGLDPSYVPTWGKEASSVNYHHAGGEVHCGTIVWRLDEDFEWWEKIE